MNIAYFLVIKDPKYTSVLHKVLMQTRTWTDMGHDARIFVLGECASNDPLVHTFTHFDTLLKDLDSFSPNVVYHRYWLMSGTINTLLNKYPLVAEINTDTEQELKLEAKLSLKNTLRYVYYKLTNKIYLKKLKGIVSVTEELIPINAKTKTIVVPNSISVTDFPYRKKASSEGKTKILFIGTPGLAWHGEDILLQLGESLGSDFDIHVIGIDKPELPTAANNVYYHGFLKQSDYADLAKQCHIGMGTLALFRKGMTEACPLKVREYLAAGFPVILPYKDTAFLCEQPSWVLSLDQAKIQNLPAHIDEITKLCAEFSMQNRDIVVPQNEVIPFIDTSVLEAKRLSFLKSVTVK